MVIAARLIQHAILKTASSVRKRPSPSLFTYPGLTAKPWHDRNSFDWIPSLESNFEVIRKEYLELTALPSDYELGESEHKLHSGDWRWHSHLLKGKRQKSFAEYAPRTAEVLNGMDLCEDLPFSYAFFSTLGPKSSISDHYGPCNLRVRCHLPLVVPRNGDAAVCGLRVGETTRAWEEGTALIFDDSYSHEAFNNSETESRVVLLFDVWHPDLSLEERREVVEMFQEARQKGWLKS